MVRAFAGRASRLLLALFLIARPTGAAAGGESEPGVTPRELPRVAVVRQPGVQTYEELIEEFRGQVLAAVRVVGAQAGDEEPLREWLESYQPGVIIAVGQQAYDLVRDTSVPVIPVLALREPPGEAAVTLSVPTTSVLAAFRVARPDIRRIGALHGPRALGIVAAAQAEARLLGMELIAEQASTPEQAISALERLGRQAQGLWLVPDLKLLSPQVLQYALMLQFRLHLPLLGATRRHTMQGALFALDHDPEDLGRQAAVLATHVLAGRRLEPGLPLPVKLSLNLTTAQRINVDSYALRNRADRVYQ